MFVAPTIALLGAAWLYAHLWKSAADQLLFRRFIVLISILAFLLNFAWELSHCPLFKGCGYDFAHVTFLALASLADAILAVLLYLGFALVYRNGMWALPLTARRGFWLMVVGGTGAVVSEMAHLAAGNWAYTASMPLIPGIGVGITPVLQFTVLPVLIYSLSSYLTAPKAVPSAPKAVSGSRLGWPDTKGPNAGAAPKVFGVGSTWQGVIVVVIAPAAY